MIAPSGVGNDADIPYVLVRVGVICLAQSWSPVVFLLIDANESAKVQLAKREGQSLMNNPAAAKKEELDLKTGNRCPVLVDHSKRVRDRACVGSLLCPLALRLTLLGQSHQSLSVGFRNVARGHK